VDLGKDIVGITEQSLLVNILEVLHMINANLTAVNEKLEEANKNLDAIWRNE